jgi:hypothetical protein
MGCFLYKGMKLIDPFDRLDKKIRSFMPMPIYLLYPSVLFLNFIGLVPSA